MAGYNGWANYETWNVSLWLGNDEGLYNVARRYRRHLRPYKAVVQDLADMGVHATPDGVEYNDDSLDIGELDEMIIEM
jgi:hypothetical protein